MTEVKLISYTQINPELQLEIKTLEELIAYVARISNPTNQNNNLTAPKLINYLINHKHWSPLEMVDITLEIKTTRDITRQIIRHRSFVFQEFSQRYSDPNILFNSNINQIKKIRLQDKKNRQSSIEIDDEHLNFKWQQYQNNIWENSIKAYNWAIENNIANEVARVVLPEGLTFSRLYMKGSLRSWIHYIETRTSFETQKEHREIALKCAKVIKLIFPNIINFILLE